MISFSLSFSVYLAFQYHAFWKSQEENKWVVSREAVPSDKNINLRPNSPSQLLSFCVLVGEHLKLFLAFQNQTKILFGLRRYAGWYFTIRDITNTSSYRWKRKSIFFFFRWFYSSNTRVPPFGTIQKSYKTFLSSSTCGVDVGTVQFLY